MHRKLHSYFIKTGLDTRHLLQFSCEPITFAYNAIIRTHSTSSCPVHAFSLFSRMHRAGVSFDHFTFPSLLRSCARLRTGRELHSLILKLGFDSHIHVQNALIYLYGSCGHLSMALKLFEEMLDRDLVSWSTLIGSFVNNGLWRKALELFQEMQLLGKVKPDEVMMLCVISAVSNLGALELGRWVEVYICRNGLELSVSLGTALIDMYSRCGSVESSIKVFDEMPVRNIATWTALINGLAVHGQSREALKVFYEMKKSGLQPDHVTFSAVLVACSHGGLVDEGWQVFNSMKLEYGIDPRVEQYGCMVDLLGRAGLIQEALDFVERMPARPNIVVWRTLLGACVNHNHLDLAKKVKERISEIDPHHDGDHVLLSNAYGTVGRWVEKADVRNSMKNMRINKIPGCSSLIVDEIVHEFVSGDDYCNDHKLKQVKELLVWIIDTLRVGGYTPSISNVLHDIEEEEKEHNLSYHSEKLAVAFSLLYYKERSRVRIMKNVRICDDCHCFMKYLSSKFHLEIIIRDRNRFHHFTEGNCSCKDYW